MRNYILISKKKLLEFLMIGYSNSSFNNFYSELILTNFSPLVIEIPQRFGAEVS